MLNTLTKVFLSIVVLLVTACDSPVESKPIQEIIERPSVATAIEGGWEMGASPCSDMSKYPDAAVEPLSREDADGRDGYCLFYFSPEYMEQFNIN